MVPDQSETKVAGSPYRDKTMIQQTLTQLRLNSQAIPKYGENSLLSQIEQPATYEGLSFEERLQLLTDSEANDRENRKQQRLLKAAKLKLSAHARDIDYQHPRGLKQSVYGLTVTVSLD